MRSWEEAMAQAPDFEDRELLVTAINAAQQSYRAALDDAFGDLWRDIAQRSEQKFLNAFAKELAARISKLEVTRNAGRTPEGHA